MNPLMTKRGERILTATGYLFDNRDTLELRAEHLRRWLERRKWYLEYGLIHNREHQPCGWWADHWTGMRLTPWHVLRARTYYAALIEAAEIVLKEKGKP